MSEVNPCDKVSKCIEYEEEGSKKCVECGYSTPKVSQFKQKMHK